MFNKYKYIINKLLLYYKTTLKKPTNVYLLPIN